MTLERHQGVTERFMCSLQLLDSQDDLGFRAEDARMVDLRLGLDPSQYLPADGAHVTVQTHAFSGAATYSPCEKK